MKRVSLTAAAATGSALVTSPPPLPRPYSLLESASAPEVELITDPRALSGGLAFWPYPAETPNNWAPCATGTFAEKDLSFSNDSFVQEPFVVYLPTGCSATDATGDELRQRAMAVFEATESMAVERQLVSGEVGTNPRWIGDGGGGIIWNSGTEASYHYALAVLEQRIAAHTGRRGVIHAAPSVVSLWAPYLIERDGVLRTVGNDTLVIAGAGYEFSKPATGATPSQTQSWAYCTGPLVIVRGEAQVLFNINQSVNDALAIVERNYVVAWDGALALAVLVDIDP